MDQPSITPSELDAITDNQTLISECAVKADARMDRMYATDHRASGPVLGKDISYAQRDQMGVLAESERQMQKSRLALKGCLKCVGRAG
jgi:hypothetical protein